MSSFNESRARRCRRARVRRPVCLAGSLLTISRSNSVVVEDLSPNGAKLLGKNLPKTGEEVLLRATDLEVLGRIAWQGREHRGVVFEDSERPSAGLCLALQLKGAE